MGNFFVVQSCFSFFFQKEILRRYGPKSDFRPQGHNWDGRRDGPSRSIVRLRLVNTCVKIGRAVLLKRPLVWMGATRASDLRNAYSTALPRGYGPTVRMDYKQGMLLVECAALTMQHRRIVHGHRGGLASAFSLSQAKAWTHTGQIGSHRSG